MLLKKTAKHFLVIILLCGCNNKPDKNTLAVDSTISYFPSGEARSITSYVTDKKHGVEYNLNVEEDTIGKNLYINDSLAYSIIYNTHGSRVDDTRKIFFNLLNEKQPLIHDTIIYNYYVEGHSKR